MSHRTCDICCANLTWKCNIVETVCIHRILFRHTLHIGRDERMFGITDELECECEGVLLHVCTDFNIHYDKYEYDILRFHIK